jgi:pyridoxamine 5'-phosphate oxidase
MRDASMLLPEQLPPEPLHIVADWLQQAWEQRVQPNPNCVTLATCDAAGRPAARVVLCKAFVPDPGYLVFYSNYRSRKGRELEDRPYAAALLHWDSLHRQVRIEGPVLRSPQQESDEYFATRPWRSRLSAWASLQSEPLENRAQLLERMEDTAARYGFDPELVHDPEARPEGRLPRPPFWGGYRLWAESVELWVEGRDRVHDRARWERTLTPDPSRGFVAGPFSVKRLFP